MRLLTMGLRWTQKPQSLNNMTIIFQLCSVAALVPLVGAFAPTSPLSRATSSSLNMAPIDVNAVADTLSTSGAMMGDFANMASANMESFVESSSLLTSFTDQGQNLAGIFFQQSLLPYLAFIYFLSFRANKIPAVANFGFQFVLLFFPGCFWFFVFFSSPRWPQTFIERNVDELDICRLSKSQLRSDSTTVGGRKNNKNTNEFFRNLEVWTVVHLWNKAP